MDVRVWRERKGVRVGREMWGERGFESGKREGERLERERGGER